MGGRLEVVVSVDDDEGDFEGPERSGPLPIFAGT
jgi:hypothetical protein